jgi:hypothetical protein
MSRIKEYESFIRESAKNAMLNQEFDESFASSEELGFVLEKKVDYWDNLRGKRYGDNTFNRKWLSIWAAMVVTVWLYAVLSIICNSALSDTVLCTLLGTTTLNVLGLMAIVLRGYFNDPPETNSPS